MIKVRPYLFVPMGFVISVSNFDIHGTLDRRTVDGMHEYRFTDENGDPPESSTHFVTRVVVSMVSY